MQKTGEYAIIATLIIGFFISSAVFYIVSPDLYNSPDETATAFWIQEGLRADEPLNGVVANSLHPRSVNVNRDGQLVPGGFLGLPVLYGLVAMVGGLSLALLATPLLATLAALAFWSLVRRWHGRAIAMISLVGLLSLAPWWYYTARGFLPNVSFVSFLIITVWLFTAVRDWRGECSIWPYVAGALPLGWALFIRPAELPWLVMIGVLVAVVYWRRLYWPGVAVGAFILAAFGGVIWSYQTMIYGAGLATGYDTIGEASRSWTTLFLPFGFHPRAIISNVWQYAIGLLWWSTLPLVAAWLWYWRSTRRWLYPVIILIIGVWLDVVYSSWTFSDTASGTATIGGAYFRYWLPVYVALMPLFGWAVVRLWQKGKIIKITTTVGVVVILILSTWRVWFAADGLMPTIKTLGQYRALRTAAIQQLPESAVIITDRHDKVFWPTFRVAEFMGDWNIFAKLSPLLKDHPVYYYVHNTLSADDFTLINQLIADDGLRIVYAGTLTGVDHYYRLEKL